MKWLGDNRWFILVVPLAAVIALAAAVMRRTEIPVRAEVAQRQTILNTISTNGKLEPVNNFEAHALAPTRVKKILVREGDKVRTGQLLVLLDDADARAQAARARAQLRAAQADVSAVRKGGSQEEVLTNTANLTKARGERDSSQRNLDAIRKLRANGSASAGELAEAETRLQRAQTEVELLERRQTARYSNSEVAKVQAQAEEARAAYAAAMELVTNANIKATAAGTVYSLPIRTGGFLNQGDLIVQVADLRKMQVRSFVDEPEIGKLSPGQKVQFTWDAVPGRTWEGLVTRVPTTVTTRGTRNVGEVVCAVDNSDLKLLPNINVSVMIVSAREENALTVSRESVSQEDGHRFVFVIQQDKLQRTEVHTGIANLTRVQVRDGIKDGAQVALGSVNGQPLSDGSPVKVVN